jgi:uncharacterized linocin/CFP29 family protein
MNHLMRDLAPISDEAWALIDEEARRSLKHFLAARRLVDFSGPLGWTASSVDLGRVDRLDAGPVPGVAAAHRRVLPLVELRTPFSLRRTELDDAERGATDLDLDPVIDASRAAALAEDHAIFNGYSSGSIAGIAASSPHPPIAITDDYSTYPTDVAKAVELLRSADIGGPYAIAMGTRCYTGVIETTEHGGYPVFEHLRQILGGSVVWAPAVDGAVVLSERGGDYALTVGEDFAVGFQSADEQTASFYIQESLTFRINTADAAVALTYQDA